MPGEIRGQSVEEIPSETESSLEDLEKRELRKQFIEVARDFLIDDFALADVEGLSDEELGEYVQRKFQENLEHFFASSGIKEAVAGCDDDEEILHIITRKIEGVGGWVDMLPSIMKQYPGAGMNCTMGSAMLHMALEELKEKKITDVRTVLVKGHHIVLSELEDGSVKLYDSGSKTTKDGELMGYMQTFTPGQIHDKEVVDEKLGRKGFSFALNRGRWDDKNGFHVPDPDPKFMQKLYAYDPTIKMDVSIALDNLSCIEADANELGGASDREFIDEDSYLQQVADFFRQNNLRKLTKEDLRVVARQSAVAKEEFIKAAKQSILQGSLIPNPYDYFKSDLLQPKQELENLPEPNLFIERAKERHEQAKELCAKYPALKNLNTEKICMQFGLFSADKFVT